jgi:hypothetical protein
MPTEIFRQGPTTEKPVDCVSDVIYVSAINKDRVFIDNPSPRLRQELGHLGGEFSKDPRDNSDTWAIDVSGGEKGIATLFDTLRNHDVLFGGDHSGWPPAAIFDLYREKGLLSGPFREIIFYGIGLGWSIIEH